MTKWCSYCGHGVYDDEEYVRTERVLDGETKVDHFHLDCGGVEIHD